MKQYLLPISIGILLSGSLCAQVVTTFNYTGAQQSYTVPSCVSSITIDISGAQGGGDASNPGGLGGRVVATIPVSAGQTFYVYVGSNPGNTNPGGYNGGGNGAGSGLGAGGGGASDVRFGGTAVTDRIIVGGGGGGSSSNGGQSLGGAGGGMTGASGTLGGNPWACSQLTVATGGTQSAGGLGGTSVSCAWNGANGTLGNGGAGYPVYTCGGGGGGYYGGGGAHNGCAGGGGSSYTSGSFASITHTQGYQTGNGVVIITENSGALGAGPISGTDSLCDGSTATYSTVPLPGATSYTWSVPAGVTINSGQGTNTINITAGMPGGNISVYGTFVCGSGAPATFSLTVVSNPIVSATATDYTVCTGTATTVNGSGATLYSWSGGVTDGVPFTPIASMTYTVTGSNAFGCSDTASVPITLLPVPSVNLGADTVLCGGSLQLDAGNAGSTYTWSTTDTTQMISVNNTGSYMVTVTDVNGCQNSDQIDVTVNTPPNVMATAAMFIACSDDDSIALIGTPAGGMWSGTGVFGSMFSPVNAGMGNHVITYVYTDANGCSAQDTTSVFVDPCLSVHSVGNESFSIYPNPSSDVVNVQVNIPTENILIELTDAQGRLVYSFRDEKANTGYFVRIDLDDFAEGVYLMRITSSTGIQMQQIVIQK